MSEADRARALLQEIADARAHGVRVRNAITGLIFAFFLIFAVSLYAKVKTFDSEVLLVTLQEQAAMTVWPRVSKELDAIAADAVPAIQHAFTDEAEQLLPKLNEKLVAESQVLQDNMNKRMQDQLDAALASAIKEREADLKGKLPDFSEDDELYTDLVRRLETSCRQWAMTALDTTFAEHVHILQSINESTQRLLAQAQEHREDGIEQTGDDVILLLVEMLDGRMNEEG